MSIKEAVQLVLQASALEKMETFYCLIWGDPVKIIDLAKQMILLNGFSVKDETNKKGDIEIIDVGLRPGEKLYEELLIDKKPKLHPLIYRGIEPSPDFWKV